MSFRTGAFDLFSVPGALGDILASCPGWLVARDVGRLLELAVSEEVNGWHEVAYDVPGRGEVVEARVCRTTNGIAANYLEPYMRRRDPDCMVIGDDRPTNKPQFAAASAAISRTPARRPSPGSKTRSLALFPFSVGTQGRAPTPSSSRRPTRASSRWGWRCSRGSSTPTRCRPGSSRRP